jgi:ferredoxin
LASHVHIETENCKGCSLCITVCPSKQLSLSGKFNKLGYNYIQVKNDNCNGCGLCYYTCPEPRAVTVYKEEGA